MRIEQDIDVFSSQTLRHEIARTIDLTDGPFTIDVRDVRYIDSVGLGLLVYAKHLLDYQHRDFRVLVKGGSSVQRILDIAGLCSLLNIHVDERAPDIESA